MRKKNLDKLFQEKFKNFSETPNEKVWQAIEASLDGKKKSRRILPIWWQLGGAAALLAIAIWVINPFENNSNSVPAVVESEKNNDQPDLNSPRNVSDELQQIIKNESGVAESNQEVEETTFSSNGSTSVLNKSEEKVSNSTQKILKEAISEKSSKLANSKETNADRSKNSSVNITKIAQDGIAASENNKANEVIGKVSKEHPSESSSNDKFETLSKLSKQEETKIAEVEDIAVEDKIKDDKKSIFDEIDAQKDEEEALAQNSGKRWSAGPSVAPVFFNSFGEGSPIHSIFVPNNKSGELNMSYGLSVAYEINSKLKIRSGLHKVDFGYDTDGVEFSSSLESSAVSQIDNIDYASTSRNLVVQSNAQKINNSVADLAPSAADVSAVSTVSQNGIMSQQFGYLEIPVELEYALIDNKLGINLIGGFSSLFLIDNMVSLSSGDLTTDIGEANNLNNVNFSTNLGVGLRYNFWKNMHLNIDPVFKYQLNTFSQTDGTFQPFSIGVYSGLSFKF